MADDRLSRRLEDLRGIKACLRHIEVELDEKGCGAAARHIGVAQFELGQIMEALTHDVTAPSVDRSDVGAGTPDKRPRGRYLN